MYELKPCPFCGNNPVIVCLSEAYDSNYLSKIFEIICKGCGAKGQNVFRILAKIEDDGEAICDDGEKQRAINAWNRRADNGYNLMDFEKLREICKFYHPAFDIDHNYIDTCRMPEMIPSGASWGDCNERECPFVAKDNRGVKHDAI